MTLWRRLLVPGLTTGAMLVVLVGLGIWQLERLAWKRALLAELDAADAAPPVPLPFDPKPLQKVSVDGRWLPDLIAYYGAEVRDIHGVEVLGAQALVPLQMENGSIILVDRGWIPMTRKVAVPTQEGVVSVTGWLHPPEQAGLFTPPDSPLVKRFYTLDPTAIATVLNIAPVLPFVLVEIAQGPVDGFPIPAAGLPRPPNDHLGYALTWFALAASLLGVFGAYAWRVVRPRKPPARPAVPAWPAPGWAALERDPWAASAEPAPPVAELPPEPPARPPGRPARERLAERFARIATIRKPPACCRGTPRR